MMGPPMKTLLGRIESLTLTLNPNPIYIIPYPYPQTRTDQLGWNNLSDSLIRYYFDMVCL